MYPNDGKMKEGVYTKTVVVRISGDITHLVQHIYEVDDLSGWRELYPVFNR